MKYIARICVLLLCFQTLILGQRFSWVIGTKTSTFEGHVTVHSVLIPIEASEQVTFSLD